MRHRNLLATFLMTPVVLIVPFAVPSLVQAAMITVVNFDGPNEGFNDPTPAVPVGGNSGTTLGAQRLIAFQAAANLWGTRLTSSVEILVGANFDPLFCTDTSAVLGSASPTTVHRDFIGAPVANTWYPQALANSLAGSDLAPGTNDIEAFFNSSIGTTCPFPRVWYYGLDANPPPGQNDFFTVVLHELGHGLGFLTLVNLPTGAKLLGFNDTYMLNLEDHSTGKLYPDMSNAERVAASTNAGNLHWVGPNVVAASGFLTNGRHPTGHVEMFAPNPQQPGSSVSHFSNTLSPDELMEPFYTGPNRDVELMLELFADIGWSPLEVGLVAIGVFRPSLGRWFLDTNQNGATDVAVTYGISSDIPVPGDYDGNEGLIDLAVFRPSQGRWFIDTNRDGVTNLNRQYGAPGDIPVPGDYNGDGITDLAVFRPSLGRWFIDTNRDGVTDIAVNYGTHGDIPVPADYNGDAITDLAVFRPSVGRWFIDTTRNGVTNIAVTYGVSTDIPVPADYDGDGRADLAVFRRSIGRWFIDTTRNGVTNIAVTYGVSTDIPVPGDYSGDLMTDIAVFRPVSGQWFLDTDRNGATNKVVKYGAAGDRPLRVNGWILQAMGILPQ